MKDMINYGFWMLMLKALLRSIDVTFSIFSDDVKFNTDKSTLLIIFNGLGEVFSLH